MRRKEMGARMFLSLKLSIQRCHQGLGGTVLPIAPVTQSKKWYPSFFFRSALVGICEQLLLEHCLNSSIFIIFF